MITPLKPQQYFTGIWHGKGKFHIHNILHIFIPDQTIIYTGRTKWITDELWISEEEFALSQSGVQKRITYIRIIGQNRLHTTCDDILGGADILLRDDGFSFTPYYFKSPVGKSFLLVKCMDNAIIDKQGKLHDQIKMYYAGVHLATMNMEITIYR